MNNEIILASQEGNLNKIKQASNLTDACSLKDKYGRTILHYACWNGHYKIVEYLYKNKTILPNNKDIYGFTPLHLVVFEYKDYQPGFDDYYKNDYARNLEEKDFPSNVAIGEYRFKHINIKNKLKITELLVSSGADINSYNQFNCTPLHYVAANGDLDILLYLIEHGAYVNAKNLSEANPLFDAVRYNNLKSVKILFKKGADINCKTTNEGCSLWINHSFPLYEACHRGFFKIAKYLVDHGANINQKNDEGSTALSTAVCGGFNGERKKDIVEFLLKKGADANAAKKGSWRRVPILSAICRADHEILEKLFKHGAKIPVLENKNSLVHYLAEEKCESTDSSTEATLRFLLNNNYDINAKNNNEETPLNLACDSTHRDVAKLLLKHGADPNIPDKNGITPLQVACMANNFSVVKSLIQHGAKLSVKNSFSKTPFQCTNSWKIKFYLLFHKYL